jgi:hypothetical protein
MHHHTKEGASLQRPFAAATRRELVEWFRVTRRRYFGSTQEDLAGQTVPLTPDEGEGGS